MATGRRNRIRDLISAVPPRVEVEELGEKYSLTTEFEPPLSVVEVRMVWGDWLPPELIELWCENVCSARILSLGSTDGVEILDPLSSREQTDSLVTEFEIDEDTYSSGDYIVGKFPGDDRRLLFNPQEGWMVDEPIYLREDWTRIGSDLADSIDVFISVGGSASAWLQHYS